MAPPKYLNLRLIVDPSKTVVIFHQRKYAPTTRFGNPFSDLLTHNKIHTHTPVRFCSLQYVQQSLNSSLLLLVFACGIWPQPLHHQSNTGKRGADVTFEAAAGESVEFTLPTLRALCCVVRRGVRVPLECEKFFVLSAPPGYRLTILSDKLIEWHCCCSSHKVSTKQRPHVAHLAARGKDE